MRREKAEPGFRPHPCHGPCDALFPHHLVAIVRSWGGKRGEADQRVHLEGPSKQYKGKKRGLGGGAQPHTRIHVVTVTRRHTHRLPPLALGPL